MTIQNGQQVYASSALALWKTGLGAPIPLPAGQKAPPPEGWTGGTAPRPKGPDIHEWIASVPDSNIGIRLGDSLVGIDVDYYGEKRALAARTLDSFEAAYGSLPQTWVSSAREWPSGIRWYRLPRGFDSADLGDMGPGIEVIRAGHRYAVVPPSIHPEGGRYHWRNPDGEISDTPPMPRDLAFLSQEQADGLKRRAENHAQPAQTLSGVAFDSLPERLQTRMRAYRSKALAELTEQAKRYAALAEGERIDGHGWESWLAQQGVPRAIRLDASPCYGSTGNVFLMAIYNACPQDPRWGELVKEKWAAKREWALSLGPDEPGWLTEALAGDPTDPLSEAHVAPKAPAPPAATTGTDSGRIGDSGSLADAHLAEDVAKYALSPLCKWAKGLRWMRYTDNAWRQVPSETIIEITRTWLRDRAAEEVKAGCTIERMKALQGLLSANRIRSITGLTPGILEVKPTAFENHPDYLNVANGVVDLRTGALLEHDPEMMFTKITSTRYVPGARSADWDQALKALPPEVVDWMQLRIGQAATGYSTSDDILPICQGSGENGKTTFFAAIRKALGEFAVAVPERALMANPNDHPTELMTLFGARFAIIEETPEARQLSVKRLKDTVGSEVMTARYTHQDTIEWVPTHSLFLTSNYTPRVNEVDHGTWRRLALVKFPYRFVADKSKPLVNATDVYGDPALRQRVTSRKENLEAVLAWIVEGARRWYAAGQVLPRRPHSVEADTFRWRTETDQVLAYILERLTFDPNYCVSRTELVQDFNSWIAGQGSQQWSDRTFNARFEDHEAVVSAGLTRHDRVPAGSFLSRPPSTVGWPPLGRVKTWRGVAFQPIDNQAAWPVS